MLIELPTGVQIELEDSGGSGPAILLIMGLGGQLIHWPPELVQALLDDGWRVLRPDNRDAGLSTHWDHSRAPSIGWLGLQAWLGGTPHPPYTLSDMADDLLGVLNARGLDRVHVLGISMGAMIGQWLALRAPERVLSLVSFMGCSGRPSLMRPRGPVLRAGLGKPGAADLAAQAEYAQRFFSAIASPRFPPSAQQLREAFERTAARRLPDPAATARQMAAIVSDVSRVKQLGQIRCPTLVLHGAEDPLLPPECARDTARRIPDAQLQVIPDMGHDLVPAAHPEMLRRTLAALRPFLQSVQHRHAP